jgi:hypothetical protein
VVARADMESASSKRQSVQAAGMLLPEELSASIDVGVTLVAMVGINLVASEERYIGEVTFLLTGSWFRLRRRTRFASAWIEGAHLFHHS